MTGNEPAWTTELLDTPHDVSDKAGRVRRMFNRIAARYQLINTLFSAGRDAVWRRKAVELGETGPDDEVLDIACGTGDFARSFASGGAKTVVGCDFAHEMLKRAVGFKSYGTGHRLKPAVRDGCTGTMGKQACSCYPPASVETCGPHWCEADALRLPFRSGTFSITSCAFGVRNFEDLDAGLAEMFRVLRPGGRAVILEFTRPRNRLVRGLFELYSNHFMPAAATLVSGDKSGAYRYLPRSVVSFPGAGEMVARLRSVGFTRATAMPLSMGIVTVYVATRN